KRARGSSRALSCRRRRLCFRVTSKQKTINDRLKKARAARASRAFFRLVSDADCLRLPGAAHASAGAATAARAFARPAALHFSRPFRLDVGIWRAAAHPRTTFEGAAPGCRT